MKKKKDNGLRAIICLAVATIVVGGASIALSTMDKSSAGDNGVATNRTALETTGANAKIREAYQNADGTYTVVIAEQGYIGEMIIEAVYSADGQTLVSYDVVSHTETDDIGTKVTDGDYKETLAGVTLPITANGIDLAAILGIEQETPVTDAESLKDGTYEVKTEADDKGNYTVVTLTVEGGNITSLVLDEMYGGEWKSVLSKEGKYVMRPIWSTQMESIGAYVVENQTTDGILNESGYTDTVSGVSVYVGGYVGVIDQAIAKANGVDGTYEVKTEADDKGNYIVVTLTVEGGKIAGVVIDEMYGGEWKSVLAKAGKYVMRPVWATQAESLGAYVVENQTTDGILNEKGYTDTVSGVSVYVGGYVDLMNQAIAKASGVAYKDGTYEVKTEADDKGNYTIVTLTVEGGKVTSLVLDEMYGGEWKSVLSKEGKYVMRPIWSTQMESIGAYVVENQTTSGILNESGYTDTVSGVSVYVGGYVGVIDQAIAKANGVDGTYEVKTEADDKGNYIVVTLTVEGGKIAGVVIDEMYGGEWKSVLAKAGKYVMRPIWATQAESLGAYVVENQTTDGILNEKGYTDTVSGVSVYVGGYVDVMNQALAQASASAEVPGKVEAPSIPATSVDVVTGATFTSRAVIRAIDEGFVFLRDFILNK